MRRSRSIRLVLLGATAVTLGACGDEDISQQGEYFSDEAQCSRPAAGTAASAGTDGSAGSAGNACSAAYAEAQRTHAETAPRYTALQECETFYGAGNCEVAPPPPEPPAPVAATPAVDPATGQPTTPPPPPPPTSTTPYYHHYRPVMSGFWFDPVGTRGYHGAPIYRDRTGSAFSGNSRVGQFSSAGSFRFTGTRFTEFARPSTRGGFGGARSVAS